MNTTYIRILTLLLSLIAVSADAQVTQRVSLSTGSGQGNHESGDPRVSADGRYVAFYSFASNIVAGDTNGRADLFVRDRTQGTTERVSLDWQGGQSDSDSTGLEFSSDGRFVLFQSFDSSIVPDDTNGVFDVFIRDLQLGLTERISYTWNATQPNQGSFAIGLSRPGQFVIFGSHASNMIPPQTDTNSSAQVYIRDRQASGPSIVSVNSSGEAGNGNSSRGSVSDDGRFVAFMSQAPNLVTGDTNAIQDIFVRDRLLAVTERVSVNSSGDQANFVGNDEPTISGDGRYVAFESGSWNLVVGDTNGVTDILVRDRLLGITERVSVDSNGVEANGQSWDPSLSADGRFVAFQSDATNLVAGSQPGTRHIYLHDRHTGSTTRVSSNVYGVAANQGGAEPSLSADGRFIVYSSASTNLVYGDTNGRADAFLYDRLGGTSAMNLCSPGQGGVAECPCGNSPSGPNRGCNNSANTGGAQLVASGGAYLSSDTLVLSTSGGTPNAVSLVVQGDMEAMASAPFGQGVQCVNGAFKRMYLKSAVAGSIVAPSYGTDVSISERSAALSDSLQAGDRRWYFVYYRDPGVLGGCSPTSTFNLSNAVAVDWAP